VPAVVSSCALTLTQIEHGWPSRVGSFQTSVDPNKTDTTRRSIGTRAGSRKQFASFSRGSPWTLTQVSMRSRAGTWPSRLCAFLAGETLPICSETCFRSGTSLNAAFWRLPDKPVYGQVDYLRLAGNSHRRHSPCTTAFPDKKTSASSQRVQACKGLFFKKIGNGKFQNA
jgi:hypothetical protein